MRLKNECDVFTYKPTCRRNESHLGKQDSFQIFLGNFRFCKVISEKQKCWRIGGFLKLSFL